MFDTCCSRFALLLDVRYCGAMVCATNVKVMLCVHRFVFVCNSVSLCIRSGMMCVSSVCGLFSSLCWVAHCVMSCVVCRMECCVMRYVVRCVVFVCVACV